jgi:putative membrane protein
MKHLIKHAGYLVLSATVLIAAACSDTSTRENTRIENTSADINRPQDNNMEGGGTGGVTPTMSQSDTMVNNTNASSVPGTQADMAFINDAISNNIAEIASHKAAVSKAESKEVKMHAQHMLTDHMKLGDDMKAFARKKNYNIPMDAPADKKQAMDAMNKDNKGAAWDKAYIAMQVQAHQETIAKFQAAEKTVVDPELKNMIAAALPKLQTHLQMVQDAQSKMK